MLSYYLKCKKNTESIIQKFQQLAMVMAKKSKFIKKQEAKGLLSNLVLEHP